MWCVGDLRIVVDVYEDVCCDLDWMCCFFGIDGVKLCILIFCIG